MSMFGNFSTSNSTSNTTGGGPFGASTNPQPAQPSLFGGSNANTNTNPTGTGLFGSNTNPPNTTGGSIFGGGNTAAGNQPAAPTGTGLFGAQSTPLTGASLFSMTNNPQGTTNPGGLFGSNTTTQQAGGTSSAAPATGGNIFGGGGTLNTGGSLFGGATGGGLFGGGTSTTANTQQQQGTTGGGLFGGAPTGTGLFGAKPATGTGLFGSTTTNPTMNTNPLLGSSLLGQPQQQQQNQPQQPQQQSSFFGSTGGNPLFGGNKSTLGVPSQQSGLTTSALGPPSNLLASRSTTGIQSSDPNAQFAKTIGSIEAIYNAWNPASKDCRFQTYFYNLVDPSSTQMFVRPPNATNDALWEQANRNNPDPSCLVPVMAVGFDDLRARFDAQTSVSDSHNQKLTEVRSRLATLNTQHSVGNASRILRAAVVQTQLAQRVMRFVQHLHLLIPAIRSSALRPEEEKLRGILEELEEEMRRERVKSRLNELWALIGAVGASVERSSGGGAAGGTGGGEWAVVDEEGLAQIAQILAEQQTGLQHLTRLLQKDQKDLGVILGNAANTQDEEDGITLPIDADDKRWGSTSTLRASALR
ncbi:hypothetical protein BDN70DRAFT_872935 [Pholiota conissans]|uniref:Nucleoporin Nup54 alpha-helical domain-containing protein n=1 Tax=Pholiota conissans TaxID=109636 RepID=A0A9P5ZAR2_9AGAR|nr:hypothetical protein BDN70DRAFT_872935 [Pholiota conissans]